jgi:Cu(I)/Ag(I) efflux system membrane protein CusA/SilA
LAHSSEGAEDRHHYDRSDLIERSVDNLKHTLIEELVIVSLVIMIFLWHFPSG